MKKFKLKGQQLYKKHAISVLMQAQKDGRMGNFVGKGLKLKWVPIKE